MAVLANVTLTNTFDEWRTRTNQIIYKLDQIETTNTIYLASNSTNALSIQGTANLGANVFLVIRTSNSVFDQANANIASMFVANQIHELAITSYNSGNTVYTYAANNVLLVANTAYNKANAANVYADSSYLLGQLGFNKANSANFLAYTVQNASIASYDKANAANIVAKSAYDYANTTYTYAANNVMRAANSAYAAQNTTYTYAANTVRLIANSAYGKANTNYTYAANNVMLAANSAFARANVTPAGGVANNYEFVLGTSNTHTLVPDSVWTDNAVLTDGASIAVDFSKGFNFGGSTNLPLVLNGDRTLANPSNLKNSQSGVLWFTAATSSRTLTLGTNWWLCQGVEADPYTIAVGALLGVAYIVNGSYIYVTAIIRRDDYDAE